MAKRVNDLSTKEQVDNYLEFAEEEYISGRISEDVYHKVVLTLASEYLQDFGDLDKALVLLNQVPVHYYEKVLLDQLKEDFLFASVMIEFIYHLNRFGFIEGEPLRPTQAVAEA